MRKSLAALSVAVLVSSVLAMWSWRELQAERARNAELVARIEARSAIAGPSSIDNTAPAVVRAAASSPSLPAAAPAAPAETSSRHVHGTKEEWEAYQRRLMQDPKYRDARRTERRLQLSARRDDAMRLLGFTPEDADAVIDLWVDRELQREGEHTQTVDTSPEGLQRLKEMNEAAERAHQDQVRELVGEEKRARWQSYLDSLGSRSRIDQLRTQLTGADALRDDQVEPLIAALHAEFAQYRRELGEYRDTLLWEGDARKTWQLYEQRQIELLNAANERAHASAASILSAAQLRRMDELLQRDVDRHLAQQRISRLRNKLDAANSADATSR
jgi:hypothetical protein